MKIALALSFTLSLIVSTSFGQQLSESTSTTETVTVSDRGDVHVYTFNASAHSEAEISKYMSRYDQYLEYSTEAQKGQINLKVTPREKQGNFLFMKRALISLKINSLKTKSGIVSVDEFYSKYSLQR